MARLCLFVCVLAFTLAGCVGDANKAQWDEFCKDLRGDNMKMRSDYPTK